MNVSDREQYLFIHNFENYYEFYSEGPNGKIKKVVEYFQFKDMQAEVFNLSFGDWDSATHCINDLATTNNGDRDKVLATVAATVIQFMEIHPNAILIATGSTSSRNRLYQMAISKFLYEIKKLFHIEGFADDDWHPFRENTNYDGFLLKKI